MKCCFVSKFGDVDTVLGMTTDWPRPTLDPEDGQMLIRVEACSLNPIDCHMLNGKLVLPPSFPYIPGMGVCGVVEEISETAKFQVGDRVIASTGIPPVGGLAEYMVVPIASADLAPVNVDDVRAAALPNSAMAAMVILRHARVSSGDRVMILGGSGGVGTALVQLVKSAGAGFVATTSTDSLLMESLGVDQVIDYRTTKWYELSEFKKRPFDIVVDCVGWRDEWLEADRHGVLKPGWKDGRYLAIANSEEPKVQTACDGVRTIVPALWREAWTSICPWKPRYEFAAPKLRISTDDWPQLTKLVEDKRLRPVLDPASPFPFTIEGVKQAFELQASRHAHGKVVIKISP